MTKEITVVSSVTICDFCQEETSACGSCYGCGRHLCQEHSNAREFFADDNFVGLCGDCVEEFHAVYEKCTRLLDYAESKADEMLNTWKERSRKARGHANKAT